MSTNELLTMARKFVTDDLRPQDKESFEASNYEDALKDINGIQSQREETKKLMNMKRMHPFLIGMENLEKVLVAIKFQQAPKAMACVWGSIRFFLKAANLAEREIDNILDVYERLGNKIPPLYEYACLFMRSKESETFLVHIYRDILTFHRLAYRLFSLRTSLFQKLYKPTWKALGVTIEYLVESLHRHGQFIQLHGSSFRNPEVSEDLDSELTLEDSRLNITQDHDSLSSKFYDYGSSVRKHAGDFEDKEKHGKEEARTKVLEWISASKETEALHKKFQDTRICSDTGRWLFKRYSEVTDWMKEDLPPQSAIWLHGNRGFGKTILASLLIDELCERRKNYVIEHESKVYYFYCQEADSEHRTHLGILRGILHQMVNTNEYLLPFCAEKAESSGTTILANIEIAQALAEAFFEYNSRQYVVIDGLDECETAEEMYKVADFFMRQVSKCDNDIKQGQLRVLFMSQMVSELAKDKVMPEDDARIQLKPTDNAEDIRAYVKKRVPDFSKKRATDSGFNLSEDDSEQLVSVVCGRSEDMFLYAHLAIEYLLQQRTKEKLLEKIQGQMLPEKLSQIYEKLLGAVKSELLQLADGEEHWNTAKLLLGWLVCAKRPLRWHEMQYILSYDPVTQNVDFDKKMLRQEAQKYLGSLVHFLDGGHIRIIHSTARRYIVENEHIKAEEIQCELTVLCLKYLCLLSTSNTHREGDHDEEREKERLSNVKRGLFSFQDYACSQWHSHVDTVIKACGDLFHGSSRSTQHMESFGSALQSFVDIHDKDLTKDQHADLKHSLPSELIRYESLSFYKNLCILWNHIYTHQKSTYEIRNTVGIAQIDKALEKNRSSLETLPPNSKAYLNDTIADYYGPNLFKCKRVLCRFFYLGYEKKEDREAHNSRHDRPYQCPAPCNLAPLGFATKKDKERHVRIYHPDLSEGPSIFEALRPRGGPTEFKCSLCGKQFTRKITQLGHERSHFGERPYKCSHEACGKAFARLSDCQRHWKIHLRKTTK